MLGASVAAAQRGPRDHRPGSAPPPPPPPAAPPVAGDYPREAPPAPRAEASAAKAGFVWVAGHWEWRAKKWEWLPGHYERERAGKKWRDGRWDRQGDRYTWVAGGWDDAGPAAPVSAYPREAPPPPRAEAAAAKAGFVWVPGHWEYRAGKYEWLAGHYERERAGKKWRAGRWDKDGDNYKWYEGDWEDAGPVAVDYPRDAPPSPRAEAAAAKAGFVWVPGHWEFRAGKYEWLAGHYERERAGKKWREGRWDRTGDRYTWVEGEWIDASAPSVPPPPSKRPPPDWKLERPVIGSYFPQKGKVGARVVIRGKNLPPDAQVLWAGAPVAGARVTATNVTFTVPAGAASGPLSLRIGRRELPIGAFEVAADYDAIAAQKAAEEEARKAAEAAAAARLKELQAAAADAAARRAAIQRAIDARAASRDRRREERIAAVRAKWEAAFLSDADTRDELVLHAQRVANLARLREVAELTANRGALVRIELAFKHEDVRHDDRMAALKAAFKGGK
ncbi:MAG: YXWGXW repeat-containing protein [Deltaproteobacteria bacterium]|nr:YXWGXW repeat-containing protein [Deltaproteobacteria bacterium]